MNANSILISISFCLCILIITIFCISKQPIENFSECSLFRDHKIDSVRTVISINKNRYDFEYSIQEVQNIINKYKDNRLNTNKFITWLNKQEDLFHDDKKFYLVKQDNNELIIYRDGKAYGFHVILSKNKIYVKGIIMEYVIDKMVNINNLDQTLEYIHQRHASDSRYSAYV